MLGEGTRSVRRAEIPEWLQSENTAAHGKRPAEISNQMSDRTKEMSHGLGVSSRQLFSYILVSHSFSYIHIYPVPAKQGINHEPQLPEAPFQRKDGTRYPEEETQNHFSRTCVIRPKGASIGIFMKTPADFQTGKHGLPTSQLRKLVWQSDRGLGEASHAGGC